MENEERRCKTSKSAFIDALSGRGESREEFIVKARSRQLLAYVGKKGKDSRKGSWQVGPKGVLIFPGFYSSQIFTLI